ncbi:endonuclease VII domain-containing protein [Micromonospora aurantiaca]|nr:endonuclease VII domain-containing protein [Micromonospora aurantiaca]
MKRRPRDIGTAADKPCKVCGKTRPKGRTTYCSDECSSLGLAEQHRARQERRMQACQRCGGQKEFGTRGSRFCTECRRLHGDTVQQLEQERSRRRQQRVLEGKLADGKRIKYRSKDVPDGQKWCARCQEFRPVTSFPLRKEGGKPAAYCKPCQRFYNTERRIKLVFGLTWDEYELLLACQDGKCAICGGRPRRHMLAVDHDHKTGEIRGLLCSRCNHKLLGSANDDPARLRRAADYLEEFAAREVFGDPKYVPGTAPSDREVA